MASFFGIEQSGEMSHSGTHSTFRISKSKSFSFETCSNHKNQRGGKKFHKEGAFKGPKNSNGHANRPQKNSNNFTNNTKLNVEVSSSASSEQVNEFLKSNNIQILGQDIPPVALTFAELHLPGSLNDQIKKNKWHSPSPIQSVAIPVALKGRDLVGIAKTGSGKTGAFVIPAMYFISQQPPAQRGEGPVVLVLTPTRELAQQIADIVNKFCSGLNCRSACLFGGSSRGSQIAELRKFPSIVVATPGRLIDFIESGDLKMSGISFLILDEADQMLDMGFEPQLREIVEQINPNRQTIMFSATWPKGIRQLASDFLVNPVHMVIGSSDLATNSQITQIVEKAEDHEKLWKCLTWLSRPEYTGKKILIFTKTKQDADDLAVNLAIKGFKSNSIHGDKPQNQRDFIIRDFKGAKKMILVATDVAARGIDVNDIDLVINYDFPGDIESYVHRIGRTARGNKNGTALTFFSHEDHPLSAKLTNVLMQSGQQTPEWLLQLAATAPKIEEREAAPPEKRGRGKRNRGGRRCRGAQEEL